MLGFRRIEKGAWQRLATALVILAVLFCCTNNKEAVANSPLPDFAVVWCVDASGSMELADRQRIWLDAVALGVDLAPNRSRGAFVAINDRIVSQTPLVSLSQTESRAWIKLAAGEVVCAGNTNFNIGLATALEILIGSQAEYKSLFFVADIIEAGFKPGDGNYSHFAAELAALTRQAVDNDVKVYLLFLREPEENYQFMPQWHMLADNSGGGLYYITTASLLPSAEDLYLTQFPHGIGSVYLDATVPATQRFTIKLPEYQLERVRLYISSDSPISGTEIDIPGSTLRFDQNRLQRVYEFNKPFPAEMVLTVPAYRNNGRTVFLLADSDIALNITSSSVSVRNKTSNIGNPDLYRQKTTVRANLEIVGVELLQFSANYGSDWRIVMINPVGEAKEIETVRYENGAYIFDFYPDGFGEYRFRLHYTSNDVYLTTETAHLVQAIDLEKPAGFDLSVILALFAGILIITGALYYVNAKKNRLDLKVPTYISKKINSLFPKPLGIFHGKLDIYGVLVDSGKTDIPPVTFQLNRLEDQKRANLDTVMELSGIPYHYRGASDILLLPGEDGDLIVRNHSTAVVFCSGQPYIRGQQATLSYGQKIRVVFEEGVNEYEIYYHHSVEVVKNRIHINRRV